MAEYLKSLGSIRERTQLVLQQPQHLQHFDVHLDQMDAVVNAVMMLIVRDYSSPTDIPPHSRWRHFEAASAAMKLAKCDRINPLLESWKKEMSSKGRSDTTTTGEPDEREQQVVIPPTERADWESEKDKAASSYNRSEGLALASLEWFMAGGLSSDTDAHPLRADATGLAAVTHESLSAAFQVNQHSNPLVGVEGRCLLLNRLGDVCAKHTEYFGSTPASNRPGNLVDYLLDHSSTLHSDDGQSHTVDISLLWHVAMDAFAGVWPPLALVWTESFWVMCGPVEHWLLSSLLDLDHLLNPLLNPPPSWRALTVGLLDMVADCVRKRLSLSKDQLPLAKVLEAGTWKAGREIAAHCVPSLVDPD
ncbi:hypothetical protein BASA83_012314 [Batrachochytrium salamandrivorans]|nr:hypothetical protein BASA83_012314 [Batrachochytrium salamandrivorans]